MTNQSFDFINSREFAISRVGCKSPELYNIETGDLIRNIKSKKEIKMAIKDFNLNDKITEQYKNELYTLDSDGKLYCKHPTPYTEKIKMPNEFYLFSHASFCPNEKYILTSNNRGLIKLWSIDNKKCVLEFEYLPKPRSFFMNAYISPDLKYICLNHRYEPQGILKFFKIDLCKLLNIKK